jgi:cephalosporin hydroxylase
MSMTDFSLRTDEERVVLLKDRRMVDGYCDLFQNREIQNIVEFGIFEGGSPILFAAATSARKIISFDIRDRVTAVEAHARKFGDRVKLVYNTSQVDRAEIYRVVDEELGEQPIDLVIDDASHDYNLTKNASRSSFRAWQLGGFT